jgi:YHS domain-containing protein
MNRCITCGKIVTRPKAQNPVECGGHTYLVCCPLCDKEFHRDPAHYTAVARSLFGDYAVKAHSHASQRTVGRDEPNRGATELVRIVRNLKDSFEDLERENKELAKHLDQISASGGLEGLRNSLSEHRSMRVVLEEKMAIHAGVCRFVLSVTESAADPKNSSGW